MPLFSSRASQAVSSRRSRGSTTSAKTSALEHPIISALLVVFSVLFILPGCFTFIVLNNALAEQNVCYVGPTADASSWSTTTTTTTTSTTTPDGNTSSSDTANSSPVIPPEVMDLFGTYKTFEDASYYFIKTPYPITPTTCLPSFSGWWSITTLSLTLLSPNLQRNRLLEWRESAAKSSFDIKTSPSITWDQSHKLPTTTTTTSAMLSSEEEDVFIPSSRLDSQRLPHSSHSNRWCCLNQADLSHYKFQEQQVMDDSSLSLENEHQTRVDDASQKDLFRICATPQASILSSGDKPPFFIELPLHAPSSGTWKKYEPSSYRGISSTSMSMGNFELHMNDDDDDYYANDEFDSGSTSKILGNVLSGFPSRRKHHPLSNPYQIDVQCHVRDISLAHLAHGSLADPAKNNNKNNNDMDEWSTYSVLIHTPNFCLWDLPTTILMLIVLVLAKVFRNRYNNSYDDWVSIWQRQWQHDTWSCLVWSMIWTFLLGAGLEPILGSITFLSVTVTIGLAVSFSFHSSSSPRNNEDDQDDEPMLYVWILFGQSILLAQLLPNDVGYSIGSWIHVSSLCLGEYDYALQLNVMNVLIWIYPIYKNHYVLHWRLILWTIFVGYILQFSLMQEMACAPQWTVPTILLSHLWWKLQQLHDTIFKKKKTDDEAELSPLVMNHHADDSSYSWDDCDVLLDTDEEVLDDLESDDDVSDFLQTEPSPLPFRQRLVHCLRSTFLWSFFGMWFLFTLACIMTFDWTLVIGHMMVLWLAIGSQQFPKHPLWALCHLYGGTTLIMWNIMTLVGWYLTRVAIISTTITHPRPFATSFLTDDPFCVWTSLIIQIILHFIFLLHTVQTKHWSTSPHVPFSFLWNHMKVVGDEIRLWCMVILG